MAGRGIRDPAHLDHAVDHDRAHADRDRAVDLGEALVVAVEPEQCRVDPGRERHRELAAAGHVDPQARRDDPAGDLGAQERLAGVVDVRGPADAGELGVEGLADAGGAREHIQLVHDVDGRAELGDEGGRAAPRRS